MNNNTMNLITPDYTTDLTIPFQQTTMFHDIQPLPTPDNYITYDELEEFLTPLVSPAIQPNYNEFARFSHERYFAPLSSPALFPEGVSSPIHIIQSDHKKQPLFDSMKLSPATVPTYRKSPLGLCSQSPNNDRVPATPASLMKMTSSPRTLRPLISPYLQPEVRAKAISCPELENRRSAHKVAEQRRRDTLKQSFDALRKEIVDVLIEGSSREEKEKEVKLMSKVLLLQHAYEYIVKLKTAAHIKNEKINKMQLEIDRLKQIISKQQQQQQQ